MKKRHEQAIVAIVIIGIIAAYFTGYLDEYIPDEYDSDVIIGKIEDFIANRPTGDDDDDTTTDDDDDTTDDDDDTTGVVGDLNCDGVLNDDDAHYLALHIGGDPSATTLCDNGDINCNGDVNSADVRYLQKHIDGDAGYSVLYPGGC